MSTLPTSKCSSRSSRKPSSSKTRRASTRLNEETVAHLVTRPTHRKKNIIKISLSRGGSRAGSRAASPRIGTQVETAEEAPAQVRVSQHDDACVDRLVSRVVGDALWAVTAQLVCDSGTLPLVGGCIPCTPASPTGGRTDCARGGTRDCSNGSSTSKQGGPGQALGLAVGQGLGCNCRRRRCRRGGGSTPWPARDAQCSQMNKLDHHLK